MNTRVFLALATFALGAGQAAAALPFSHPAVAGTALAAAPVVVAQDAAPQLIGHPASPRWASVHAGGEHPAVLLARRAGTIDTDHFLVQPPASVQWTLGPARERETAALR